MWPARVPQPVAGGSQFQARGPTLVPVFISLSLGLLGAGVWFLPLVVMGDDLRWQTDGDFLISVIMKAFHVCPPKKCKQLISSVIAHTTQGKAEQGLHLTQA